MLLLLSSILMMKANICHFFIFMIFDQGNRPRDLGVFLTPTEYKPTRRVALPLDIPSGPGLCPREYVSRVRSRTPLGHRKEGERRNQQREEGDSPSVCLLVRLNPFASLRLD